MGIPEEVIQEKINQLKIQREKTIIAFDNQIVVLESLLKPNTEKKDETKKHNTSS